MIRVDAYCDCCERMQGTPAKSAAGGLNVMIKAGWVFVKGEQDQENWLLCSSCAEAVGLLVKCPGEAHEIIRRGGDQDHCGVCAPRWDQVEAVPAPTYDQVKARVLALVTERFRSSGRIEFASKIPAGSMV